jgi:hypothetical protein
MPYAVPTAAEFKVRYPGFAAVPDETVAYWIADARRVVTEAWIEADYPIALMLHAAHELAQAGLEAGESAGLPQGVTRFRSGSMDVGFAESVASATGYQGTRYGREFLVYLKRNRGGSIVVRPGTVPADAVYPVRPLGYSA